MKMCWFYQWLLSAFWMPGEALPRFFRRHFHDCSRCQALFNLHHETARKLSADATRARVPASPFLHGKILAAVARQEAPVASAPAPARRFWRLVPIAATVVALSALALPQLSHWVNPNRAQRIAQSRLDLAAQPFSATVKLANGGTLVAWSESLEKPLHTEIQSVVIDAKTVLAGLAKNFLTDDLRAYWVSANPH